MTIIIIIKIIKLNDDDDDDDRIKDGVRGSIVKYFMTYPT